MPITRISRATRLRFTAYSCVCAEDNAKGRQRSKCIGQSSHSLRPQLVSLSETRRTVGNDRSDPEECRGRASIAARSNLSKTFVNALAASVPRKPQAFKDLSIRMVARTACHSQLSVTALDLEFYLLTDAPAWLKEHSI